MPNSNPQAVKFVNEWVRPSADKAAQKHYKFEQLLNEWNANNLASLFPIDADPIMDGSETDGRNVITNNDVRVFINQAQAEVADYVANNNTKLNSILKPAVNVT